MQQRLPQVNSAFSNIFASILLRSPISRQRLTMWLNPFSNVNPYTAIMRMRFTTTKRVLLFKKMQDWQIAT